MVNKVIIVGNLGADPDIRSLGNGGGEVANFTVATSEKWKDKQTGERREKTEWHRVVVFGNLVDVVRNYVKKGTKLYIEGKLQTRKWEDKDTGQDRYTTEIVLTGFDAKIELLAGTKQSNQDTGGQNEENYSQDTQPQRAAARNTHDDLNDDIPF